MEINSEKSKNGEMKKRPKNATHGRVQPDSLKIPKTESIARTKTQHKRKPRFSQMTRLATKCRESSSPPSVLLPSPITGH
jgi:hypothetical protein